MMGLGPCGHKQAKCVVANYWQCPICDAPNSALSPPQTADMVTVYLNGSYRKGMKLTVCVDNNYFTEPAPTMCIPWETEVTNVDYIQGPLVKFKKGTLLTQKER